jgi:hypothetical protein
VQGHNSDTGPVYPGLHRLRGAGVAAVVGTVPHKPAPMLVLGEKGRTANHYEQRLGSGHGNVEPAEGTSHLYTLVTAAHARYSCY